MDALIDALQRRCASAANMRALAGGLPADELFPRAALESAFPNVLRSSDVAALQYSWPEGIEPLRDWIAARLRSRGAAIGPDDVIVTAGAQQGLAIAVEALSRPGATIAVDAESYAAALDLFRLAERTPSLDIASAAFVYAMPAIANPRGRPLSSDRRSALLACSAPIVEDDAYAALRFDGCIARPLLADARHRVWHVGTISKTLCPGLRIGWLVPPPHERRRALAIKQTMDLQAGGLAQALLAETLKHLDFDAHLVRARHVYEARAEAVARALRRELPTWSFLEPEGGFSIFVETGEEDDDAAFLAAAAVRGVSFDPGRLFRHDGSRHPLAMRLCYSALDEHALADAVTRLARAWRDFRRRTVSRRGRELAAMAGAQR